jgi:hypothetical protein
MALIAYPEREEMKPEAREMVEVFEREHGRATLVRRMLAHFPPALKAVDGMYHPFMAEGTLGRKIKELMFVASSQVRGCFY